MNIEDLISQYIDGSLSSEAEAELHHRLAVSPEARRLFRSHIMLKGVARDQRVLHLPTPAMRSSLFERLAREEGMKLPEPASEQIVGGGLPASGSTEREASPVTPSAEATPRSIPSSTLRGNVSRRRRRVLPWLIPIVMAGLMIGILWNVGDQEERNAGTIAGRNVEDVPPAPGERGADMANPSSPQAGLTSEAAPRSDRGDAAPPSTDHSETAPTANSVDASARNGSAGPIRSEGYLRMPSTPTDGASGTYRSSERLSSTREEGTRENNRAEVLADKPSFAQNMGSREGRSSAASRRSAPRNDDRSFEAESTTPLRPRHRGPEIGLSDGSGNTQTSGDDMKDGEMSEESLRAKEDQGGGSGLQLQSGTLGNIAANTPSSSDTTRWFDRDGMSESSTLRNERYGSVYQENSTPSRTMAAAPEIEMDQAAKAPESEPVVVQSRGASSMEKKMAAETKEKSVNPPVVSSVGVENSYKKEAPRSVPSDQMMAAAPPPPPMMAYDSIGRSADQNGKGSNRKSEAMMSSSDAALEPAPSRTRYVAGLEQRSMIDLESSAVTVQVIARGGAELGDFHQIYLLVGGSNDREDGLDIFGGAGYRYMLLVSRDWNIAVGGWSGAGARYFRSGMEIPVIYQINRVIRIELIPTLHYIRRIDGAGIPDEDARVTPGIGIGAGVRW